MNAVEYKLGYNPFKEPDDHAGLDVLFWPSVDDQIAQTEKRLQQVDRALQYYMGNERDYEDLKREQTMLTAIAHTLKCVKDLQTGNRAVD